MINLCGPCAAGTCTGPGHGGICDHPCHQATTAPKEPSRAIGITKADKTPDN